MNKSTILNQVAVNVKEVGTANFNGIECYEYNMKLERKWTTENFKFYVGKRQYGHGEPELQDLIITICSDMDCLSSMDTVLEFAEIMECGYKQAQRKVDFIIDNYERLLNIFSEEELDYLCYTWGRI